MRPPTKFRVKSTELSHFKALVIFVFAVYGVLIPLWFAFHGNKLLGNNDQWRRMVITSTSTRIARSQIKENGYFDAKKNLGGKSSKNEKYLGKKTKNDLLKHRTKRPPTLPKPIHSFYLWPMFMPPQQPRRKFVHRYSGRLLSMKWEHLCCQTINCLRKFPLFPLLPSKKKFIRRLKFSDSGKMYGQRITGLLMPPESGSYAIYIKCLSTCEFWLSDNEYPLYTRLKKKIVSGIPVGHDMKANNSDSRSPYFKVRLEVGRAYFMDFLLTVYRYMKRPFEISWKLPSKNTFIPMTQEFFMGFQKKPESMTSVLQLHAYSPSVKLSSYLESIEERGEDDDDFTILGGKTDLTTNYTFLDGQGNQIVVNMSFKDDHLFFKNNKSGLSFKECSQKPLFVRNKTLSKHAGVWKTSFSSVFPGDTTGHMMCIGNRYPVDCQGNRVMSHETVSKVLTYYSEALRDSNIRTKGDLKMHRLVSIKEKRDRRNGSLILMDAIIKGPGTNSTYYDSQYFYLDKSLSTICQPPGYIVGRDVTVNIIVVAKRQTRWLRHFLVNMERIYVKTNDKHINVIIAKYGHDDEELMEEYKRSRLPSIRTVRHRGAFDKRKAIRLATKKIKDKNSIIFLMDLHIIIPDTIIQLVRKYTIQGQMVFNPVLFRLSHCGSPASSKNPPRGFWETFGYGIMGIYKSDWDKLGKLRTKKYKKGWGGEDWELLDRVLTSGLAVQRFRVRNFYHFHHSKKGLWN
ncbi:uncharacterized protein LOC114518197 [Dendronephthya gigantea]|uniref:uncharacterized protein LOC114518197 n=1 Tax=Dendronephthya gigantea TaxID=151771 RepID=UPI0010696CF3|nr:uncharacterized protein LOC114518197 [Dendronephthya gigantea]